MDESKKILDIRDTIIKQDNLRKRLKIIQGVVENKWSKHAGPPWHTFHDSSHSFNVENILYKIIPPDNYKLLKEKEWFYLISGAWLHDIGMVVERGEESDWASIRDEHHLRSIRYIQDRSDELDFSGNDITIITSICKYHRRKENIANLKPEIGDIRLKLLAAYLRLADALHLDTTRIDDKQFQLLLQVGMPWESRFHWLKSKWVPSIIPKPTEFVIEVTVYDTQKDSITNGLLPQLVSDEIQEELDSIRDILIKGKIGSYLEVVPKDAGTPTKESERTELEMVLSNIKLEELLSASEAVDIILKTFLRLTDSSVAPYNLIQDYYNQVNKILNVRPCHNLIKNLLGKINKIVVNDSFSEEQKLKAIQKKLEKHYEQRKSSTELLSENAVPFLSDEGSILLFGYSSMVLSALSKVNDQVKANTKVFIAECRGKTQYNHKNEIRYCDGVNYAEKVKSLGFSDVTIIPDISVGNLMARRLINKVVFGANGIDFDEGKFGHTSGHLSIADLAKIYQVPVYVIADVAKFGSLNWQKDLEREIKWLARDRKIEDKLLKLGIKTMNPREDVVDPEKITMLITDVGAFPPYQIPQKIKQLHELSISET